MCCFALQLSSSIGHRRMLILIAQLFFPSLAVVIFGLGVCRQNVIMPRLDHLARGAKIAVLMGFFVVMPLLPSLVFWKQRSHWAMVYAAFVAVGFLLLVSFVFFMWWT